jgi:transcriptional regulator with XRE-family HTH domain
MTAMPRKKSPADRALGAAIRVARSERGYTQESFAAHAGIDRAYYGAIERGEFNITVQTLLRISTGLNVSPAELLARSLDDKPSPVVSRAAAEANGGDA